MQSSEIDCGTETKNEPKDVSEWRSLLEAMWFPFTAKLRLRRLTLKQSVYDDHWMNDETLHINRQIMKDFNAVSVHTLLLAVITYTRGV
jgi:hypothetical protein